MIVPTVLGIVTLIVAHNKAKPLVGNKSMTPSIAYAFKRLLDAKLTVEQYEKAADLYEEFGLRPEAELLRKRAKLRALSPEKKKLLSDAVAKAMASTKPDAIRDLADSLQEMGALGSATNLRKHADDIEIAAHVAPIPTEGGSVTPPVASEVPHVEPSSSEAPATAEQHAHEATSLEGAPSPGESQKAAQGIEASTPTA